MTDRATARDSLSSLVLGLLPGIPILWDDRQQETPASGTWARVTIKHTASRRTSIGPDGKDEHQGFVTVQLFTPFGDGLSDADDYARTLVQAMRQTTLASGVRLMDASAREVGPSGAWHQTNVTAEFNYWE